MSAAAVGLYVHFPFCLSVCPYCDFVVVGGRSARGPASQVGRLVDALVREIELRSAAAGAAAPLGSVYLGGGTPSLMSPEQVARLLDTVAGRFGIAADAEITLEVNPGPAERGQLGGFRAAGVNRLSVGAQSMAPAELRPIGRRHSPADVVATFTEARRSGFDELSMDLLYDLPGQTRDSWAATLAAALALAPTHVSAYALSLADPEAEGLTGSVGDHLPTRAGARRWRERARRGQDDDRAADMYLLADELLGGGGLDWYEISNWSRPGHQSRHNLAYWTGAAWQAVGPGAHAFDGAIRRWNAARLDLYLAALEAGRLPPGGADAADRPTRDAERALLRLRTSAGVPAGLLDDPALGAALRWGVAAELLETIDGRLALTRRGRLLAGELFVRLLPERAGRPAA